MVGWLGVGGGAGRGDKAGWRVVAFDSSSEELRRMELVQVSRLLEEMGSSSVPCEYGFGEVADWQVVTLCARPFGFFWMMKGTLNTEYGLGYDVSYGCK